MQCHSCEGNHLDQVIDLEEIPIAHKFHSSKPNLQSEFRHPMTVHICNECGLLQILRPIDPEILYKDFNFCFTSWKTQPQTVPEIEYILRVVGEKELVVEVGSNDGSFLNEMKQAGLKSLVGVEPNSAACAIARRTEVPVLEGFFDSSKVHEILSSRGPAGLVVSRQVVEHIKDLKTLMDNVRSLLKPAGWVLFEVPDFEVPLQFGDVSSLWEEHISYFTEASLTYLLTKYGFRVAQVERFPTNAGALMILAQKTDLNSNSVVDSKALGVPKILELARDFALKADAFKRSLTQELENNHRLGIENILYGTGCRSNTLIHGFKLTGKFDRLVDDQPEKQGLYMPGTHHQISSIQSVDIKKSALFLSVNFENEDKVLSRLEGQKAQPKKVYSVNCPSSRFPWLSWGSEHAKDLQI